MNTKKVEPRWWQVYAMLPVLVGLFLVEMRLPLTDTEHIAAQLGILLLIYGFVHAWLGANRRALMGLDDERGEWRMRVYEFPPAEVTGSGPAASRNGDRPMLHIPEAGLKGVLSTTFEIDPYEEASAFPAGSDILFSEEIINAKSDKA